MLSVNIHLQRSSSFSAQQTTDLLRNATLTITTHTAVRCTKAAVSAESEPSTVARWQH